MSGKAFCTMTFDQFKKLTDDQKWAVVDAVCTDQKNENSMMVSVEQQTAVTQLILQYMGIAIGTYWITVKVVNFVRPLWRTFMGKPKPTDAKDIIDATERGDHAVEKKKMARKVINRAQASKHPVTRQAGNQLGYELERRESSPEPGPSKRSSSKEAKGQAKGKGKAVVKKE